MKEKTIAMATAFSMLLAVGVTGFGGESLHESEAYRVQQTRQVQQRLFPAQELYSGLMLNAPESKDGK